MYTHFPLWLAADEGAAASTASLSGHQVLVFLVQLTLLVGVARLAGTLLKRLGQPPVVGELLAGVILGPSLFGLVWPSGHEWVFTSEPVVSSATFGLAWLGVVFLLVVMGYETDLGIIARFRAVSLVTATGSLLAPLIVTGVLGYALADEFAGPLDPPRWVFAAFFALALSVSALPVVGKILSDLGVLRRNFGQITLAAAMVKDAVGWLVLAVLSGVALGQVQVGQIAVSFGGLAIFVFFMFTLGRSLLDRVFRKILARGTDIVAGLSVAVIAGLVGGAVTQALHVEAILGAYLVGIALARVRHQLPAVRERLETVTGAFFAPVFFAFSGLRVDVTALADLPTLGLALLAIALAVTANVSGTIVSARLVGVDVREGTALGSGLSALGVMGVVVAIVGLNEGVIGDTAYTILLLAAVVTSLLAPILLKWAVGRWEPPTEEADRLERESLVSTSEILGAHRILLPTRGGLNSVYAARLVSAVFPDAEVTVLTVEVPRGKGLFRFFGRAPEDATDPSDVIDALGDRRSRVVQRVSHDPADAILTESRLGYGLLVVGASQEERMPVMATVVERVLRETGIQTLVVQFPDGSSDPVRLPRSVMVPVTATRSSRAAEEFGYSVANVAGGRAVALHVVNRPDGEGVFLPNRGADEGMRAADDLLASSREFAQRLGVQLETSARLAPNAEQEILDYARREDIDLLVLGTASRPMTNRPFFGHRISYIAENSPYPLVIVALPSVRGTAT
ncbi:MAG: cation:proton antiporter [Actinomycetota bacterium]